MTCIEKGGLGFWGEWRRLTAAVNGVCPHMRPVMQWVGAPLDMGAIRIHGDEGRRVFDYVKGCLGY